MAARWERKIPEELKTTAFIDANNLYIALFARRYNLSLGEAESYYKDHKIYYKFLTYGTKNVVWNQKNIQALLAYREEGFDDDQIAELMLSSVLGIRKSRSDIAKEYPEHAKVLLMHRKVVVKGHSGNKGITHSEKLYAPEAIQRDMFYGNEIHEKENTFIAENSNGGKLYEAEKSVEDDKYFARQNDMNIYFHPNNDVMPHIERSLSKKLHWRQISKRIQNPQHYHAIEENGMIYNFEQVNCDPYTGFVELKFANKFRKQVIS